MPFPVIIERIIPGGRGLAFHEGRAVFVPLSVPGDKILVHQFRDCRSYFEVQSLEVLEPSPERQSAPCPYFGKCGGCDFQHMSYERQLASKREILVDALKHVGKIHFPPSQISITPSAPLGYRNRIQLKVSQSGPNFSWGFFERASHRVCSIENCLIVSETLWKFLSSVRNIIEASPLLRERLTGVEIFQGDKREYLVDLQVGDEGSSLESLRQELQDQEVNSGGAKVRVCLSSPAGEILNVLGEGYVWKTVGGLKYRVSHGSFFQVNDAMLEQLRNCATSGFSGKLALDLYCGVGFFSLALAKSFEEVSAVEMNASSVEDFQENVRHNRAHNCKLFPLDLNAFMRQHGSSLKGLDLILIDPPRIGLPKETVNEVAAIGAVDVVYVSCDPSTLARDLRIFLNHQYQISSIDILDLFPQTHHFETAAKLRRLNRAIR